MTIKSLFPILFLAIAAGAFFLFSSTKGESPVKWKSFDSAITESKQENRKMVISVYTDWCSWCKKMEKSTYGNENVASYLNENFIPVKVNAESREKLSYMGQTISERELSKGFNISGYPSTVFLDENQQIITVIPGYIEAEQFLRILQFFKDDSYKTMDFEDFNP